MKALPVKLVYGQGYLPCSVEEATHVTLNIPGPTGRLSLPVIQSGTRAGTGCWTWNGSTDAPTLRPSVLTQGHNFRCHSWINDGQAQFLDDCSHEMANTTVDLLDVARCGCARHMPSMPGQTRARQEHAVRALRRATMSATQQQVQMAAKLYECRDTAKRLFGDGYKARMDAYGQTIKSMVKTTDMNELQAAMHSAKETGGMAAVCYLAAFVEMTEPSA